jgi:hypothetical protein
MGKGYRIFAVLYQGTIKVLRDSEAEPQQEEGAAMGPVSSESVSVYVHLHRD